MVNVKMIKSLMGGSDHTKKNIANLLGISTTALKNKLNGLVDFKAKELKVIADLYGLPTDDLYI